MLTSSIAELSRFFPRESLDGSSSCRDVSTSSTGASFFAFVFRPLEVALRAFVFLPPVAVELVVITLSSIAAVDSFIEGASEAATDWTDKRDVLEARAALDLPDFFACSRMKNGQPGDRL